MRAWAFVRTREYMRGAAGARGEEEVRPNGIAAKSGMPRSKFMRRYCLLRIYRLAPDPLVIPPPRALSIFIARYPVILHRLGQFSNLWLQVFQLGAINERDTEFVDGKLPFVCLMLRVFNGTIEILAINL